MDGIVQMQTSAFEKADVPHEIESEVEPSVDGDGKVKLPSRLNLA